jgi:hypothetical protein
MGTVGSVTFQWDADRGKNSGSKNIDMGAGGDLLNTTFIVNTSFLSGVPPDRTITVPFPNDAVGYRFQFQIANAGTSTLVKVKRIKVFAIALDEQ